MERQPAEGETPRRRCCSRHLNIAYQDERSTLRLRRRGAVRRGTLPVLTGFCYLVAALRRITGGDSLNTKEHRVGMAMETINKEKKIQIQNCKQNLTN